MIIAITIVGCLIILGLVYHVRKKAAEDRYAEWYHGRNNGINPGCSCGAYAAWNGVACDEACWEASRLENWRREYEGMFKPDGPPRGDHDRG